ncbi:MAG: DUF2497 domain-containing protein, partial [Hoeflea sp.]|nr:DUF2497 domain-containing protein [Hoeflea sp.]
DFDDAYALDDAGTADDHAVADTAMQAAAVDREPAPHPVSLADVAARARLVAATPREKEMAAGFDAGESFSSATDSDAMTDMDTDMDEVAAEELRDALASNEPVEAPVVKLTVPAGMRRESPAVQQEEPEAHQPGAVDAAEQQHENVGQLVSLHTVEKVAAAFGELDAAIAAGQRRSFDEIAEEMLRPMLTQWLDDNLPTLVERLVREEIERVSRGNRR